MPTTPKPAIVPVMKILMISAVVTTSKPRNFSSLDRVRLPTIRTLFSGTDGSRVASSVLSWAVTDSVGLVIVRSNFSSSDGIRAIEAAFCSTSDML